MARGKQAMTWVVGVICLLAGGGPTGCSVYDPALTQHAAAESSYSAAGQPAAATVGSVDCSGDECSAPNADSVCISGKCALAVCQRPFADCDGRVDNGCEVELNSTQHCGMCNALCRFSHATAGCTNGQCQVTSCEMGYGDCDGNPANGCERSLLAVTDCGACGHACPKTPHAVDACNQGTCQSRCEPGYADCNGKPEDGCEQSLSDSQHCGGCETQCAGSHVGVAVCERGQCVVRQCVRGFEDCNHDAHDGCEVDLQTAGSCGGCGIACDLPHVAQERCEAANELLSCQIDRGCGAGDAACVQATHAGCEAGFADCDGKPENGCETDLQRAASCGGCMVSCAAEHKLTACSNQACITVGCESGYGRCSEADECQSLQEDPKNCGECGRVCRTEAPRCVGGQCSTLTCDPGTGDCDGNPQNQCETSLNDPNHCGGCTVRCAGLAHTSDVQCPSGRCVIDSCEAGFADCDKDAKNGCEVALNSPSDCHACGDSCARAQAETRCDQGQCQLTACKPGWTDCNLNPADGCEVDLSAPGHCGSCGNDCTVLPNVDAATCTSPDRCGIHCRSGFADCDGQAANGCEAALTARTSCGLCTVDCSTLAHIQASSCVDGACNQLVCEMGYGDCDADKDNGCERPLSTATDCGACSTPCDPPHAQGTCTMGSCLLGACDSGFDNCDGDMKNGCETALTTPEHCGACNTVCNTGAPCNNGVCGCARDSDCSGGRRCCDGQCTNTEGQCFPIPCALGESRNENRANCGGCGVRCDNCCNPFFK